MEHPLIPNLDDQSSDQLNTKITELNKKLTVAYRMGNAYLITQLQMALESYNNKYQEKMRKASDGEGTGFNDIIDIS